MNASLTPEARARLRAEALAELRHARYLLDQIGDRAAARAVASAATYAARPQEPAL